MFGDDWTPSHLTGGATNIYKEIALALKANTTLTSLDLSDNTAIGEMGAQSLGDALARNALRAASLNTNGSIRTRRKKMW